MKRGPKRSYAGEANPFFGKQHSKASLDRMISTKLDIFLTSQGLTREEYEIKLSQGLYWCTIHKKFFPRSSFHAYSVSSIWQCKICYNGVFLHNQFGVPLDWYDTQLEKQGGGCALCGMKENIIRGKPALFSADHDHITGILRGLLCHMCNTRLAWFEKCEKQARAYLEMYS